MGDYCCGAMPTCAAGDRDFILCGDGAQRGLQEKIWAAVLQFSKVAFGVSWGFFFDVPCGGNPSFRLQCNSNFGDLARLFV